MYLKDYGSSKYVIMDDDLELILEIELDVLEDPEFNLIEWYLAYATDNDLFYKKYTENHMREYSPGEINDATSVRIPYESTVSTLRREMAILEQINDVLERCVPYPGDDNPSFPIDPTCGKFGHRFALDVIDTLDQKLLYVYDHFQGMEVFLAWDLASWDQFSLGKWYAEQCAIQNDRETPWEDAHEWMMSHEWANTTLAGKKESEPQCDEPSTGSGEDNDVGGIEPENDVDSDGTNIGLATYGVQVD